MLERGKRDRSGEPSVAIANKQGIVSPGVSGAAGANFTDNRASIHNVTRASGADGRNGYFNDIKCCVLDAVVFFFSFFQEINFKVTVFNKNWIITL